MMHLGTEIVVWFKDFNSLSCRSLRKYRGMYCYSDMVNIFIQWQHSFWMKAAPPLAERLAEARYFAVQMEDEFLKKRVSNYVIL